MKWLTLILFAMVALVSQMLWLNFASIGPSLQKMYGVDEFTATLPVFVFPLFYVLLSINAGALIDKKGYKKIITFGCILMCLGSLVRIADNFWIMFIGQCIIAISQPYIINGINKLVADWFDEKDAGGAVGLGTAGMFLGMLLGVGATIPIIEATNYQTMNIIMAVICIVFCLLFMVVVKEKNKSLAGTSVGGLKDYGQLLKNKNILVINVLSFLSLGFFNGLFSSISFILGEQGLTEEQSSMVGAALIGAGILGAFIIPMISDKIGKRKVFMIIAAIGATFICYPLMMGGDYMMALLLAAAMGIIFLPGYAILLTCGEEEAGKSKAGASTGLIMLSGNLGGVVVIMAMETLKEGAGTWKPAVFLCVGVLVLAAFFGFLLKDTYKKVKA
jgi:predicted MFS family arabinose efflux permease